MQSGYGPQSTGRIGGAGQDQTDLGRKSPYQRPSDGVITALGPVINPPPSQGPSCPNPTPSCHPHMALPAPFLCLSTAYLLLSQPLPPLSTPTAQAYTLRETNDRASDERVCVRPINHGDGSRLELPWPPLPTHPSSLFCLRPALVAS